MKVKMDTGPQASTNPAKPLQEDDILQGKQLWHPHKGCAAINKQYMTDTLSSF